MGMCMPVIFTTGMPISEVLHKFEYVQLTGELKGDEKTSTQTIAYQPEISLGSITWLSTGEISE
jgi:hypothetical protein